MSATLGFSVEALLAKARGGGKLRIGLTVVAESEWLQPAPDLAQRCETFDANSDAVMVLPQAEEAGKELAMLVGATGGLEAAARSAHEDMCLLSRAPGEDTYRLVGAAVAYPTDWRPADKIGLPLAALHAPIDGYQAQLANGVDRFMASLKPGCIYGRCNWFIAPTQELRWVSNQPAQQAFSRVTSQNAGDTLFARSERQTLRRLPETGAIVFTIGVYVSPLGELSKRSVDFLTDAVANIPDAEAERRGVRYFAPALTEYARQRRSQN